ncbi:MAG: dTDP-4-dehydrorhamnose reductase [Planctomycetota bacterium]
MKLFLTGARGQVGREVERCFSLRGWQVVGVDLEDFDIADGGAVEDAIGRSAPDLVINSAAYTAVDRAEEQAEEAFRANRDGPACLASATGAAGIPLFHISTDYIFDGRKKGPYREDDPPNPLGVYGRSKREGEWAVRERHPRSLILRVSWMYGRHGSNFVKTMLRIAGEQDEVRVVADQTGCPTAAPDVAFTLFALAEKICSAGEAREPRWGVYHYSGTPPATWHELAESTIEMAREHAALRAQRVIPIPTSEYATAAERPRNSALDTEKLRTTFGIVPRPWRQSLKSVLEEIYSERVQAP